MVNSRKLYFVVIGIIFITLAVVYYCFNPAKYSFFPKCPFRLLTGFYCPGCGSQRAIYFLLHGNIGIALRENVLLVISLPLLSIHFFYKVKSVILAKDLRWNILYHPITPRIIFVVVVAFWIARNIPFYPFNYLAFDH